MESGPTHTVVAAPPHLLAETAAHSAPEPIEIEAAGDPVEPEAANEVTEPEPETNKSAVPFTVLVNGKYTVTPRRHERALGPQERSAEYVTSSWEGGGRGG